MYSRKGLQPWKGGLRHLQLHQVRQLSSLPLQIFCRRATTWYLPLICMVEPIISLRFSSNVWASVLNLLMEINPLTLKSLLMIKQRPFTLRQSEIQNSISPILMRLLQLLKNTISLLLLTIHSEQPAICSGL